MMSHRSNVEQKFDIQDDRYNFDFINNRKSCHRIMIEI